MDSHLTPLSSQTPSASRRRRLEELIICWLSGKWSIKDPEIKAFIEAQTTQQQRRLWGQNHAHHLPMSNYVGCQTIHQGACVASEFHLKVWKLGVELASLQLPAITTEAVKHHVTSHHLDSCASARISLTRTFLVPIVVLPYLPYAI